MSLPRGGRDGCTSPSWNAPLPSLSVSVSPIHAGLYPALLYVSSYAHAPVLSLSLWHVSLEQTEINVRVLPLKNIHQSKTQRGWNWWEPSAATSVLIKLKSSSERGLESLKSVKSCMNICIKVKKMVVIDRKTTGMSLERIDFFLLGRYKGQRSFTQWRQRESYQASRSKSDLSVPVPKWFLSSQWRSHPCHSPKDTKHSQRNNNSLNSSVLSTCCASFSLSYCYLLYSQKAAASQSGKSTFCRVTPVPALLFPLLVFPVVGFFFPGHLLGWFDSQGIIFFSPERQDRKKLREVAGKMKRFPFYIQFPQ